MLGAVDADGSADGALDGVAAGDGAGECGELGGLTGADDVNGLAVGVDEQAHTSSDA